MTERQHEESHGHFVRVCQGLPPVEVDCSSWESDIPPGAWSHGRFHVPMKSLPAVEVDCSSWGHGPAAWIEVVISFREGVKPAQAAASANRLVGQVVAAAPDLRLVYDPDRSRQEGDSLVVALAPHAGAAEGRLAEVAGSVGAGLAASHADAAVRVARAA